MAMNRRLVGRTKVLVDGDLHWATKRLLGGAKQHSVRVSSIDLSVEGAQLITQMKAPLPAGASVRLELEGLSTPARVRHIQSHASGRLVIRVQFEETPDDFFRMIESWLDVAHGGTKFVSHSQAS